MTLVHSRVPASDHALSWSQLVWSDSSCWATRPRCCWYGNLCSIAICGVHMDISCLAFVRLLLSHRKRGLDNKPWNSQNKRHPPIECLIIRDDCTKIERRRRQPEAVFIVSVSFCVIVSARLSTGKRYDSRLLTGCCEVMADHLGYISCILTTVLCTVYCM